jgi:hypothetical protein
LCELAIDLKRERCATSSRVPVPIWADDAHVASLAGAALVDAGNPLVRRAA